jgi:hypothetical protein
MRNFKTYASGYDFRWQTGNGQFQKARVRFLGHRQEGEHTFEHCERERLLQGPAKVA